MEFIIFNSIFILNVFIVFQKWEKLKIVNGPAVSNLLFFFPAGSWAKIEPNYLDVFIPKNKLIKLTAL